MGRDACGNPLTGSLTIPRAEIGTVRVVGASTNVPLVDCRQSQHRNDAKNVRPRPSRGFLPPMSPGGYDHLRALPGVHIPGVAAEFHPDIPVEASPVGHPGVRARRAAGCTVGVRVRACPTQLDSGEQRLEEERADWDGGGSGRGPCPPAARRPFGDVPAVRYSLGAGGRRSDKVVRDRLTAWRVGTPAAAPSLARSPSSGSGPCLRAEHDPNRPYQATLISGLSESYSRCPGSRETTALLYCQQAVFAVSAARLASEVLSCPRRVFALAWSPLSASVIAVSRV
jgi:hypothetical protein